MHRKCKEPDSIPEILQGLLEYSHRIENEGVDHGLAGLVHARTSQLNRVSLARLCTPAVEELQIYDEATYPRDRLLRGWRWSPLYGERERAALAWAEALTALSDGSESNHVMRDLRRHFSDTEVMQITLTIAVTNAWNRMVLGLQRLNGVKTVDKQAPEGALRPPC